MFNIDEYVPIFAGAYERSGQNTELALKAIKEKGASAVTAILVLRSQLNLSTAEADQMVLDSEFWNTKGAVALRKEFEDVLTKLGGSSSSPDL